MSRVANNPVKLPAGVSVTINGNKINVKGSLGTLERDLHEAVTVKLEGNVVYFSPSIESANALAGTTRTLVNNMVVGVSEGFVKELQLFGVGYKAQAKKDEDILSLNLGHSHPINYSIPNGITIETPSVTEIVVKGIDKEKIGQVCADIIAFRATEPYKGKGVRYKGQKVILKEAKKK